MLTAKSESAIGNRRFLPLAVLAGGLAETPRGSPAVRSIRASSSDQLRSFRQFDLRSELQPDPALRRLLRRRSQVSRRTPRASGPTGWPSGSSSRLTSPRRSSCPPMCRAFPGSGQCPAEPHDPNGESHRAAAKFAMRPWPVQSTDHAVTVRIRINRNRQIVDCRFSRLPTRPPGADRVFGGRDRIVRHALVVDAVAVAGCPSARRPGDRLRRRPCARPDRPAACSAMSVTGASFVRVLTEVAQIAAAIIAG